jgi:CRP-like cAMP-binding protein
MESFLKHAHTKHYKNDVCVFGAGHPCDTFYYLMSGEAWLVEINALCEPIFLDYFCTPTLLGGREWFSHQQKHNFILQTKTPCTISELSFAQVTQLNEEEPHLLRWIGEMVSTQLTNTYQSISFRHEGKLSAILAKFLERITHDLHTDKTPINTQVGIDLTQAELASLLGCTREMIGKSLLALEAQGLLIRSGRKIFWQVPKNK